MKKIQLDIQKQLFDMQAVFVERISKLEERPKMEPSAGEGPKSQTGPQLDAVNSGQ